MPRQMAINGVSESEMSRRGAAKSNLVRESIASPNAPTPGRITLFAFITSCAEELMIGDKPTYLQAWLILNKLPNP